MDANGDVSKDGESQTPPSQEQNETEVEQTNQEHQSYEAPTTELQSESIEPKLVIPPFTSEQTELVNDQCLACEPQNLIDESAVESEKPINHGDNSSSPAIAKKDGFAHQTPPDTRTVSMKKKDDDKLVIYKALAIKLKKELVKTRFEFQKSQDEFRNDISELEEKFQNEQELLKTERLIFANTNATQEALIKSLQSQLNNTEEDLRAVQTEFENYKEQATQIMQKNNPVQLSMQSNRCFEEERYKQLKQLNDDYKVKVADLNKMLQKLSDKNCDLERESKNLQRRLEQALTQIDRQRSLETDNARLLRENEDLKATLKRYDERQLQTDRHGRVEYDTQGFVSLNRQDADLEQKYVERSKCIDNSDECTSGQTFVDNMKDQNSASATGTRVSPSSSSVDSYIHIKPSALEIISRSSVLEDAQKQIDDLTKAYLDSESTNSLLTEQVRALKEEIRRVQRGAERMSLADNLEYLKNIVFKFLSLDNNQAEQKQRLIPVLSTVLRLSPEETAKLELIAKPNRVSSSLFRLS